MKEAETFVQTVRLGKAVNWGLEALGCYHKIDGSKSASVPLSAAAYDAESGLSYVALDADRLPRPHTCRSLLEDGLQQRVEDYFGRRIVVKQETRRLIIIGRLPTLQKSAQRQRAAAR